MNPWVPHNAESSCLITQLEVALWHCRMPFYPSHFPLLPPHWVAMGTAVCKVGNLATLAIIVKELDSCHGCWLKGGIVKSCKQACCQKCYGEGHKTTLKNVSVSFHLPIIWKLWGLLGVARCCHSWEFIWQDLVMSHSTAVLIVILLYTIKYIPHGIFVLSLSCGFEAIGCLVD